MLSIIEILPDNTVVVESDLGSEQKGFADAHKELTSLEARNWVTKAAAERGLVAKSFGYTHGVPYPTDQNGKVIVDGDMQGRTIHRYRRDFKLNTA